MLINQDQKPKLDVELYMKHVNEIIEYETNKIDLMAIMFGSALITIPFTLATNWLINKGVQEKTSEVIGIQATKNVCTDKYGRDRFGRILNSAGLPKNPQTADDLPEFDLTNDRLVPSPIDQHGTCGIYVGD